MPNQKRSAEASRERRFGFGDAHFGTGDFGRVTANEVVHRLFGGEFTD